MDLNQVGGEILLLYYYCCIEKHSLIVSGGDITFGMRVSTSPCSHTRRWTDRQSQVKAPQQLELGRIWSSHYISLIDTFRLPFPGIAPDQVENNNNINT